MSPHALRSSVDQLTACNVVIVDDRPTNRAIFSQLAASVGKDVTPHAFGDAFEALRWLNAHPADLVVTDFKMPGLDGAEFISQLRQSRLNADVPSVVITAYADREFRMRALEAGATDFLHSPVDPREFQTRVRNLLRLSQQQRMTVKRAAMLALELDESEASRLRLIRQSRKHLAQVIDTIPAMISAMDANGQLLFVNAYQASLAGADPAALLAQDRPMFGSAHHQASLALNARVFETGEALPSYEEEIEDAAGTVRTVLTTKAPLHGDTGEVMSVLTTSTDVTARRAAERRLQEMARQDPLTGLQNRTAFLDAIRRALGQSRRGDRSFALMFVDIDRFKLVNDGRGHHVGDLLLKAVAARLLEAVGGDGVVARLGGDEFGVLQTRSPSPQDAASLAQRLVGALDAPFFLEGVEVITSASIGVAIHPRDGRSGQDLLHNADLAMYRVKIAGRRGYEFCGDDVTTREEEDARLEADLRYALARRQFVLHYQPLFTANPQLLAGAEALLRWQRPSWGLLSPSAFLPVAERSGLIGPISEWVLHEACRQAAAWNKAGGRLRISVNLSPSQVRRADLASSILGAVEAAGTEPQCLAVELTEGCIEEGSAVLGSNLARLREAGVGVVVDNFGASGVSLPTLQRSSVSGLKLDLSVNLGPELDGVADRMLRIAAGYARSLGAEVAASGIETQTQLDQLRAAGCQVFQGTYLSKPRAAESFAHLFTSTGPPGG